MRNRALERGWVGVTDSRTWRRFRSSSVAGRFMSGEAFKSMELRRRRFVARLELARSADLFSELETVCLFVGHTKSGGSLVGAMLDAHPDAVLGDEVDVLAHLDAGFSRRELFGVLVRNARREALKGRVTARRLGGYSLDLPGQWQGTHRRIVVLGESRAGPTTRRLDGANLERLRQLAAPARLRFIHVARNPLDPIAAMVLRSGRSLDSAVADYAAQAERVDALLGVLSPSEVRTIHYEQLIRDPRRVLSVLVAYLGLTAHPGHIDACVALVDADRPPERLKVEWPLHQLEAIRRIVEAYPFLAPYATEIRPRLQAVEP